MLKNFVKTDIGKQIIILEDQGYRLTDTQMDLTIPQEMFLIHGKVWINREKEKQINEQTKH